jgi:transketolase
MSQNKEEIEKNKTLAKEVRKDVLDMIFRTKSPHVGSSLSMVDLFVALYFGALNLDNFNSRDRLLLSKGHGCATLFSVLCRKGLISKEELDSFAADGGRLGQHPNMDAKKGIEITSGSLGHGLSVGAGMALAAKNDRNDYKIFVYMGDGELNEGSVWEAVMFAAQHKLDNLVAIIDRNGLQCLGEEKEIMCLDPLPDKWKSFGWGAKEIDGHDMEEIMETFSKLPFENGKPSCIVAKTIKGKGVSFMENERRWHDRCPDEAEYKKALEELQ